MKLLFLFFLPTYVIVLVLFVLLGVAYFIGFRVRRYEEKTNHIDRDAEIGSIEGSLLGLFAFFLAFTFSMSNSRYDQRREAIVHEANTIGTAILRADLYPDSLRIPMRAAFGRYIETRVAYYNAGIDTAKNAAALVATNIESGKIWRITSQLAGDASFETATKLMVPALNDMIDAVTSRDAAKNAQVPEAILWVLFLLGCLSSFLVGFGTKGESVNYMVGGAFILMVSIAMYLIIDLDRPRSGIINTNDANQRIIELRELVKDN